MTRDPVVPFGARRHPPRSINWFGEGEGEVTRMWQGLRLPLRRLSASLGEGRFNPSVDLFERGDRIVVKADLPGFRRSEIELCLEGSDLVIRGNRHVRQGLDEEDRPSLGLVLGEFCRRIPLAFRAPLEGVEARFEHGVLEVVIPKPPVARTSVRRIEIL